MTKLSITATLSSDKSITVTNTTGFTPEKTDGFLPSTTVIDFSNTANSRNFKLSEIYLFNILIYNEYDKPPVVVNLINNELEPYINITNDAQYPLNANKKYTITKDGHYTVSQIMALDKTVYESNKTTNRFMNNNYIVYDILLKKFYHARNGTYTELTAIELLDVDLVSIEDMRSYTNLFSYIDLRLCYINKTDQYISTILDTCIVPLWYTEYYVLYTTLEVIKYQIELCDFSSAQKYLEWINQCSNICTTNLSTSSNCNCS